jgi:hypothetical protein
MNMSTETALNNIYNAARLAPLTAEQHEIIRKSAEVLVEALKPKEAPKAD